MPRFQVFNEKLEDLSISSPYSHMATFSSPLDEHVCDLPFVTVLQLPTHPKHRGIRSGDWSSLRLSCVQLCFAIPCTVAHQAPVHRILWARILEWVTVPFPRGSSQSYPGIKPMSPSLAGSLPSEPPGIRLEN